MRKIALVTGWLLVTGGGTVFLLRTLEGDDRSLFLPGRTTSGHYQIETECEQCHELGGAGVRQESCMRCHEAELAEADDSHPLTKFLDPRNAVHLSAIDGRRCVSCHVEHRPSITGAMGVSRPVGFCVACHADIAQERPSHRGMPFEGCADAGCHNYHDNRALGEAFLTEHRDEPDLVAHPIVPVLARDDRYGGLGSRPLTPRQQDAPAFVGPGEAVVSEWAKTEHAAAGVNCTGCHGGARGMARPWSDRPGIDGCRDCHAAEVAGFQRGKHGMRIAARLSPMQPGRARLPMRAGARDRELGCTSCHGAHAFDRRRAAVEACLDCHDDRHSLAYVGSAHHDRWKAEETRTEWQGSGVSCATCHMPRVRVVNTEKPGVAVEHNQNASLRPIESMVRPVCQPCHGVGYSLAAMADRELTLGNFRRAPDAPARAIQMVREKAATPRPQGKEDTR